MNLTARRAARVLALGLVTAGVAAPAASADTTYPTSGGSTFTMGADGWQDAGRSCTLIVLPSTLCDVRSDVWTTGGNPPGSLRHQYTSAAGLLNLINGKGTLRSASFAVPGYPVAAPAITGATLDFDRYVDVGALLTLGGSGTTTVRLVDETVSPASSTVLFTEPLVETTGFVAAPQQVIPGTAFTPGHTYHLEIESSFTSLVEVLLGTTTAAYDNIKLTVADGSVAPTAAILPATDESASGATLHGGVTTGGPPVKTHFEYGTTPAFGQSTPDRVATTDGQVAPEPIGGLAPLTTYRYKLVVTSPDGVKLAESSEGTFTTLSSIGATGAQGPAGATG
ncbi:MAG: Fibronectin type domain protein, partial [Conexibacter sp.]|nr:Fibronectin type domain protein [Conexibacter sp.]